MLGKRLKVLMWMHLKVRMRHYILTAVECISTFVVIMIIFIAKDELADPPSKSEYVTRTNKELDLSQLRSPSRVIYIPVTEFTNTLMEEVSKQLNLPHYDNQRYPRVHSKLAGIYPLTSIKAEVREIASKLRDDEAMVDLTKLMDNPQKLVYTIFTKKSFFQNSLDAPGDKLKPNTNIGTDYQLIMRLQWAIDTSFIKMRTGHNIIEKLAIQEFPIFRRERRTYTIIYSFLPFVSCVSLAMVFIYLLTRMLQERASGVQELIKMVGVSTNTLDFSHFLNVLPAGIVYSVMSTVFLKVSSNPIVAPNIDGFVIWIALMLHFISIAAMAFPFSYVPINSQYATSTATCLYLVMWFPARFLTKVVKGKYLIHAIGIFPHVSLMWVWAEIYARVTFDDELHISDIMDPPFYSGFGSIGMGYIMLVLQTLICLVMAWYFARVLPGKYGQSLSWKFLCTKQYWTKKDVMPRRIDEEAQIPVDSKYFEKVPKHMDAGIEINNVTKVFGAKRVLNKVSFKVYKKEITILLGHNGAGKTTLMSIITGIIKATEGRVFVNGEDVSRARQNLHTRMGLCPQHNLFFPDLSVLEHAIFFSVLRGSSFKAGRTQSMNLLKTLGLQDKARAFSSALSGGMKRRMQLACALAGNPSVLILDEPTSGLDVETRRELWNLLLVLRGNHTMLLSTHFMEEADVLGDRVLALHQGQLRCHATPMYLKKAMGSGYRLTFTTIGPPKEADVSAIVAQHVPDATIKESTINSLSYNLPSSAASDFPAMFADLENRRQELFIETIGVGVTTLEEVFIKLCSDTDTMFTEEEIKKTRITVQEPLFQRVTGFPLYVRMFLRLFMRQLKYIWSRKMSFLILEVIFPAFIICLIVAMFNNEKDEETKNDSRLSLHLDVLKPLRNLEPQFSARVLFNVTDPAVNMRAIYDKWDKVGSGVVVRTHKADAVSSRKYPIAIQMNFTHAKAMFTTSYRHAAPVALNLLSNALATRYIARADGHTFRTYYQPIRSDYDIRLQENPETVKPKDLASCTFIALMIIVVVFATNINNVALPCAERLSSARHLHIMSGCPAILHWSVTCCFHMLVTLIFSITAAAVITAVLERDDTINQLDFIMTMVLVLTLGSLAFHSVIYLTSWCFTENGAGNVLTILLILFGGITGSYEGSSVIGKSSNKTFTIVCSLIGVFMPPHQTTVAMYKSIYIAYLNALCQLNRNQCPNLISDATGFDQEKCCRGEKVRCYMCFTSFGPSKELLILTAQFLVYMTLVIMYQRGIINRFIDNKFNSAYRSSPPKVKDPTSMVKAEATYVETQFALSKKEMEDNGNSLLVYKVHKNYKKCRNSFNAIKGVSFSVKKVEGEAVALQHRLERDLAQDTVNQSNVGECFGLLGVNGAGKSTMFKMLTAEECTTVGNIFANGFFVTERGPYLHRLGYCPQFFGLDEFLTGHNNLNLVLTLRGLNAKDVEKEVASWIEVVGLEKYSNTRVSAYSGGCKRRLATAAALCLGAPLSLLDEPTAGVDVSARRRVWKALLRGLRQGRAVIITSHSMDEMEALCSRIAILSGGVVQALGTPSELRAHYASGHAIIMKIIPAAVIEGPATSGQTDEMLAQCTILLGGRISGTPKVLSGTNVDIIMFNDVDGAKSDVEKLKAEMTQTFNCRLKDEHMTMLHYHIYQTMHYSDLFTKLEALKAKYPYLIEDYSATETTLEEVFLAIAKEQQLEDEKAAKLAKTAKK